jgi:phage tail sheath protein FI
VAQVEYLSPGVYGIEVAPTRAQEGISPSKMGIIGWTERGPENTPIEVRSVEEFTSFFGPINPRGLVALSMRAFFGTGGQRAWIVRVVPADATVATVDIEAPALWTFDANGAGEWGNDLIIQIEGNRNFLSRVPGSEGYTKFDLKVLQPTAFDPNILGAAETYEAVQFDDPLASDYIVAAMTDPRSPSLLVQITAGLGGTPAAFDKIDAMDEVIGTGDALGTTQFIGTLASVPVLSNTLRIVAADTAIADEDQFTGASSGPNTLFTNPGVGAPHDLATTPITVDLPMIPGTSTLSIDIGAGPVVQTDDGAGNFPATLELPGPTTVDYNTGALTGITASLLANSAITESHTNSLLTPTIDSVATGFTWNMPSAPILDGSLQFFAGRTGAVSNEPVTVFDVTGTLPGVIDGANTVYTVPAGGLTDKVHRETTVFRLKYADTASASGPNSLAAGVPATPHDLSTTPITVGLPAHPGTVSIDLDIGAGIVPQVDDGAGNFPPSAQIPLGGTINYDTGALTGITAALLGASAIDESHNTSSIITKTSTGSNTELLAPLAGAVTAGTIDLVDNVTTPTANGPLAFTTSVAPITGTTFFLDFVRLLVVNSDVAGNLTGDIGIGNNTADFTTGDIDVEFAAAPLQGETLDATYQTGQVAIDDGLGNLIGDVDAAGENTVDYTTGDYDITWDSAPTDGTSVLANYVSVPRVAQWQLAGGGNGTAVTRADISDPALEDAREGVYAFDDVEDPLNLVVPDFEGSLFVQADVVDYCEARNTRFYVIGFANGTTKEEAIKYVLVDQAFDTKVAAIYWPNVYFVNEVTQRPELIPVTPFIAGVYAKTSRNKNVGKAPAGLEDGALDANGTVGPEFGNLINDVRVRDDLYQSRINPLFNSDATGFVVWGARSLSTEFRWRYINARLLHNFLMDAINRQLQWAVFENNGPQLWIKIETALKGFMGSLYRQGYFAGVTEAQAFFVVCNATNNNQSTVDEGKVIIDIGFSPFKPAEFIIFRLSQPASTITV